MAHPVLERTGVFLTHTAAIVVGVILMAIGLGRGVTIAALPIGVPIGLLGFAMVGWGLFERFREN